MPAKHSLEALSLVEGSVPEDRTLSAESTMLLQRVEELEWAISGMSFEHARRRRTTERRNAFRPDVCGVEREGVVLSAGKDASREKNTSSRRYTVWDRRRAVAKLTAVAMSAHRNQTPRRLQDALGAA